VEWQRTEAKDSECCSWDGAASAASSPVACCKQEPTLLSSPIKSSMLQSLERGRRLEFDLMNDHVVEKGQEQGVPTPANEALTGMAHEIEAGRRSIRPNNLASLLRHA
jgi:ketopantoate reductase